MITAFFLGGTISMSGTSRAVARLGGADLLGSVPDLDVEADAVDFRRMPSASFAFADLLELAVAMRASQADGAAEGFVVVQGTDTIEETAFLLDLLWASDAPVVVTGAMRTPAMAGADGPANLLAALRVASSPDARDQGVLVVLNDEIHAARHVQKRHTISTAAFASPETGPLGRLVEGVPVFSSLVARRPTFEITSLDGRVPVVPAVVGDDGTMLGTLACDGLVVAGFGAGHVPEAWVEPLSALVARVPVVLTSRIAAGPVLTHTYGAPGSETDLLARGVIHGGGLTPYQARLLLLVALASGTADIDGVFAAFR